MGICLVTKAQSGATTNLTGLVNTFVGTGGGGDTFPGADMPSGMVQWSPDTTTSPGGYRWTDTVISRGFSLTHFSGRGVAVYQDFPFMPVVGTLSTSPATTPTAYGSSFSHTNESAAPGYYSVLLDTGIQVELTVTPRCGIGHFTYPSSTQANMIINANGSANANSADSVSIIGTNEVTGQATSSIGGSGDHYTIYFAAFFDHPFTGFGVWNGGTLAAGVRTNNNAVTAAYATFDTTANPVVLARVGISFVSVSNALLNLSTEIPGWDFNAVRVGASNAWNTVLNRIQVTGGTTNQQSVFYTALYHSYIHPNVYSDVNGQYFGYDGAVHTQTNHVQYENMSSWDNYRSLIPLISFLSPVEAGDMMQSLVNDAAQGGGAMPQWEQVAYNSANMVGDGPTIDVADAYAFGATNFDVQSALNTADYAASTVGATSDGKTARKGLSDYLNLGYVSSSQAIFNGHKESAPAVTLEYANADFALSQLALTLGDTNKYQTYRTRSGNWRNVFNPDSLWTQLRNPDGSWDSNFTLTTSMVESDSYTYTWMMPFNLRGLFDAMGGNTVVTQRLDTHFTQLNSGQSSIYAYMGNEPEGEVPWEYNFAGAPWRAQDVVRRCVLQLYNPSNSGIPGNDDGGAMSAWVVWAMMGIYPEIPGVGGFVIGSPLFSSITVTPESGHVIQITGINAADTNQYMQSLLLNGQPSEQLWLPIATILGATNTTLVFTLTNTPNMNWGDADSNAPPSFTDGIIVVIPPAVSIVSPANGSVFIPGTNITFNMTASTTSGVITSVTLLQGSTSLAVLTNAPYTFVWSNVAAGNYTMTAKATNSAGIVGVSSTVGIFTAVAGSGINLTTTASQSSGSGWSDAIWKTNGAGMAVSPIAGNTYACIPNGLAWGDNSTANTRIRNSTASSIQTFPGDSLTLRTNTEIRFKAQGSGILPMNFPGVGGQPGLILNGGVLNTGDDGVFPIIGTVQAATGSLSYFTAGNNGGGSFNAGRSYLMGAQLSGGGTLAMILFATNIVTQVTNSQNTFVGNWIVQSGWLRGTTNGSLGFGNLIVNPHAAFPALDSTVVLNLYAGQAAVVEMAYPAVSPGTLTLTNGGLICLHSDCMFLGMTIEGTALSPGKHTYAQLTSSFPTNFLPGGSGSITVTNLSAPVILNPSVQNGNFSASFQTMNGAQYQVRCTTNLSLPFSQWTTVSSGIANGSAINFTDSGTPAAARFYRILILTP